jgi:tripartite-type tricarboxylate transporter receptor subunit TctC
MVRHVRGLALLACCLAGVPAQAEDFYAGKSITLSTHTGPGGGYDTLLRLVARHLGRFIPGSPGFIATNMPGAGGLTAFNHAARLAPQDGTFLTLVGQGLIVHEPTGQPGLQASLGVMNWIGNASQSPNVTVVWHTSPVKSIEDARHRETLVGSTGAGSPDAQMPRVYNALLGTRFKVINGYGSGSAISLALESGEVVGVGGMTWASLAASKPNWVAEKKLNILAQAGIRKAPDLPDTPLLTDLASTKDERAVLNF